MFPNRISQLGALGTCKCIARKMQLRLLASVYGFDIWHASAPYECRPYKREVINLAEVCRPTSVLEIGCGLGDIVGRISANNCIGIDIDESVIAAATKFYGNRCSFFSASISDNELIVQKLHEGLNINTLDLLILVNWTHNLPWKELKGSIEKLVRIFRVKNVLIDGIYPNTKGFAFYHGATEFQELGNVVSVIPASDGVRMLYQICTE